MSLFYVMKCQHCDIIAKFNKSEVYTAGYPYEFRLPYITQCPNCFKSIKYFEEPKIENIYGQDSAEIIWEKNTVVGISDNILQSPNQIKNSVYNFCGYCGTKIINKKHLFCGQCGKKY